MADGIVIFADFNNADDLGRLRLNCRGTKDDLARTGIELHVGMRLELSDGDLAAVGVVDNSQEEGLWVAAIDWDRIESKGS